MQTPGTASTEPDTGSKREPREENDVPEPTPQEPGQSAAAREVQEENAETSLDQPSQ
jgi:hypothetical protein